MLEELADAYWRVGKPGYGRVTGRAEGKAVARFRGRTGAFRKAGMGSVAGTGLYTTLNLPRSESGISTSYQSYYKMKRSTVST